MLVLIGWQITSKVLHSNILRILAATFVRAAPFGTVGYLDICRCIFEVSKVC